MKTLHMTTHLNSGGITSYIHRLIKPLKKQDISIEVLSSGGELSDLFRKESVELHEFPIKTKSELSPRLYLFLPKIIKMVRHEGIELMHAHTRVTQVLAHWVSRATGIPYVTTCHGFYKKRLGRRLLPAWGSVAIAISEPVKNALIDQLHVDRHKIVTILNGIDLEELDHRLCGRDRGNCKLCFGFDQDDRVVGITGRLVPIKGHELLLHAFKQLRQQVERVKLLIVGGGKIKDDLRNLARHLNVEQDVVFSGELDDVSPALCAMDVFAFPVTEWEGFGLSPVEAMGAGVPVVTSPKWPVTAYFSEAGEASIVDPLTPTNLAQEIGNLLKDKDLGAAMSQRARKLTETRFTSEQMGDAIAKLYKRIRLTSASPSL